MSSRSTVVALVLLSIVLAALARVIPAASHLCRRTSVASQPQPDRPRGRLRGDIVQGSKRIGHHYDEILLVMMLLGRVNVGMSSGVLAHILIVAPRPLRGDAKPPFGGRSQTGSIHRLV